MASSVPTSTAVGVPLTGLDKPYSGPEQPVLEGDRMALDLKSLHRSQLDYTLGLETETLAEIGKDDVDAVVGQLAADPRWRVYEEDDVLVAARRVSDGAGGWTIPANGYHPSETGPWRVMLRFDAWPSSHPWRQSEFVARVPAGQPTAKVSGFVPYQSVYEGNVITALSIEGPALALDVYESSHEDGRERTAAALGEVPAVLYNSKVLANRIRRTGHEVMLLPPGEPSEHPTKVQVTSPSRGELEWQARIEANEAGWVWLRLVDGKRAWEEVAVSAGTREQIGWSNEPGRSFFAQGRFHVPSGDGFRATAEVWFLPERGDARVIASLPVEVPAR